MKLLSCTKYFRRLITLDNCTECVGLNWRIYHDYRPQFFFCYVQLNILLCAHNDRTALCLILPLLVLSSLPWLYSYAEWQGFGPKEFVRPQSGVGHISLGGFCTTSCRTAKRNQGDMKSCEWGSFWLKGAMQPRGQSEPNRHEKLTQNNVFIWQKYCLEEAQRARERQMTLVKKDNRYTQKSVLIHILYIFLEFCGH